jgi:hypothetical protein
MDLRAFRRKFSARGKLCLDFFLFRVKQVRSLKAAESDFRQKQSNVRELRENRRRLRHCNGYKFQCH